MLWHIPSSAAERMGIDAMSISTTIDPHGAKFSTSIDPPALEFFQEH
jgi:hypothetical protein